MKNKRNTRGFQQIDTAVRFTLNNGISYENLIHEMSSDDEETNGTKLSFQNISYEIDENTNICSKIPFCKVKQKRTILSNVSGTFEGGMNAILGPTGCGKSTLLDILADRKDRSVYDGSVFINNCLRPSSVAYRYMIGYVVQDDIFSGTLTVRENIFFSANLRLPQSISYAKRLKRVEKVIQQLGLSKCANTRMGTESERGVSGGERKRTCIAMELVLKPRILFLDEPTTGLDASTACNVMSCLRDLAQQGHTIIFSIHQPRYSIFELFDNVLLMLNGHTVYFGSSTNMIPYFTQLGYTYRTQDNPADFALDVLNQANNASVIQDLSEKYRCSQVDNRTTDICSDGILNPEISIKQNSHHSFLSDFHYVSERTLRNALRNSALLMWQIAVAIILGLLTGLLYYQIPRTVGSGIQNRLGGIFFIVVNQIFSTATALEPFIKERALFMHENISGYYSISTLFLAKLACDLIPLRVIPSVVFSSICYFMTGLQQTSSKFIVFLLTIFMANVFGSAMCFLIAAIIPVFAVALIVLVLVLVIMMVFSGFLVDLSSVFSFLRWIKWVSAFNYASNVLYINEFRNLQFCLTNNTNICPSNGNDVLRERAIDYTSNWDIWKYFFSLTLMAAICFFLSYIKLLFIKKVK